MKKLLLILAISGLVFISCANSEKKAKNETTEDHNHGDATHSHHADASHQEEFTVDSTKHATNDTVAEHTHVHEEEHGQQH
ncbi:MAG: hypothetical protein JXR82_16900 [Marinifilaceae bacterium]|nr:hypothetical protein [Marinifilaceae bacterium]